MLSKKLLTALYILVLLTPIVAWARHADLGGDLRYEVVRLAGLLGFTLIFLQLTLGAFMLPLRQLFGSGLLKVHITQGLVAFSMAMVHPLALVSMFGLTQVLNLAGYARWGQLAWLLIWVSVAAGLLRTRSWMSQHWRWIHRLNYVIFVLIYWHSWQLGMDTRVFPMVILYYLAPVVFVAAVAQKIKPYLKLVKTPSVG